MSVTTNTYLGDGLFVEWDGFSFILRAPREGGDHYVALEPDVLNSFLDFIELIKSEQESPKP